MSDYSLTVRRSSRGPSGAFTTTRVEVDTLEQAVIRQLAAIAGVLETPKGKRGSDTVMPFTAVCPASSRDANASPRARSEVHTALDYTQNLRLTDALGELSGPF